MENAVSLEYDDNAEVIIGNVTFRVDRLCVLEYFNNLFKYQSNIDMVYMSEACALLFKRWLYKQDEILPSELTIELGVEIRNVSDYLNIKFYIDIHNALYIYAIDSNNADIQFNYIKEFEIVSNELTCITKQQVDTLDKSSFVYACCLEKGIGCEVDKQKAYEIHKANWEINKHAKSLCRYAIFIEIGQYCKKDEVLACQLYKMGWELYDHSFSLNHYAWCLQCGIGCKRNVEEAIRLFKLNWDEYKNCGSLYRYARCLYFGIGTDINLDEAFKLFKIGWEQCRDSRCLHMYAICLLRGIACECNKQRAFDLFKMNWEQNKNVDSLHNYATMLRDENEFKDDKLAYRLFNIGMQHNDTRCVFWVGYCLRNGIGCEQNEEDAYKIYITHAEKHKSIKHAVGYCLFKGLGCNADTTKAREIFKTNWELTSYKPSLMGYIECLENGYGGPRDIPLAAILRLSLK